MTDCDLTGLLACSFRFEFVFVFDGVELRIKQSEFDDSDSDSDFDSIRIYLSIYCSSTYERNTVLQLYIAN